MLKKEFCYNLLQNFVSQIFELAEANIRMEPRNGFLEGQLLSYYETLDSMKNDLYCLNVDLNLFNLNINLDIFFHGNHSLIPDEVIDREPLKTDSNKEDIQVSKESLDFCISRIIENVNAATKQNDGSEFSQGKIYAYNQIIRLMNDMLLKTSMIGEN